MCLQSLMHLQWSRDHYVCSDLVSLTLTSLTVLHCGFLSYCYSKVWCSCNSVSTKYLSPHCGHPPHVFSVSTFFLKSYFWALIQKTWQPFPGPSSQCLVRQRDLLCTMANTKLTKCQRTSSSYWSWSQGTQHLFSSSSRSWSWEKLTPTRPSEIPELAGYTGQLWFDALHHPLESHKVMHTKWWNRIDLFFNGLFSLIFLYFFHKQIMP